MALAPGTRLGPYQVTAQIGMGGMGEVWCATDTNLGRQVAIKILPDAFAHDPERLARFEREAKTLASLNHPNIAQIYGLEKTDRVRALVLELVEGPTLAERIAQGPIPLDDALPIARQLSEALEAAHEQNIIHRDLKPSNIKLRPDGTVKVLDFGLAKVTEPVSAMSSSHSLSPTITTPAMTQMGMILGTAAYMSPEQAKGRPADKRSDVWAFGCVLFEMLTGQRAFDGEDTSDTLASVLKSEPDWAALPTEVTPAIRTLLRRCLMKDRRQRIADMSVANFVLSESVTVLTLTDVRPTDAAVTHNRRWRSAVVGVVVIGAGLLVGLGTWMRWPSSPEHPVARFSFRLPEGQRFTNPGRRVVAISPDGSQVAYVANLRIYLRSVSEFESHVVTGVEVRGGVLNPVFSPDGGSLAFFSNADQTVRRVSLTGGAPVMICAANAPTGMTWDVSGIVFGQGGDGIRRCRASGGMPEQLASVDAGEQASGPQILLGGEFLIFAIAKDEDGSVQRHNKARIVVQSLVTGARRTLIDGGSEPRYLPTGHLLYALGGSIFAVSFDPARQMVTSGPVSVVEGIRRAAGGITAVAHFDISNSGNLLYVPGPVRVETSDTAIVVADRSGAVTSLKTLPGPYHQARASRDGTRVAVDSVDGKEAIVWIYELAETSAIKRLTFGGANKFPIWAPDSQRVAFQSDREGDLAIFAQRTDGTGVERLTKPDKGEVHVPESWSPDGRHISYSVLKDSEYALWILSLADRKTARFSDVRSREPIGSVFSADGRWIAYHSLPAGSYADSANSGVFVEPFPATGARYQAPRVNRDFQPLWSRDGTELFYIAATSSGLTAVPVKTASGVTFGTPQTFPFSANAGLLSGSARAFDALPDGRFIGLVVGSGDDQSSSASQEVRVVLNWTEELKRLVSAN
jgi:serine/threonine-protein kinase